MKNGFLNLRFEPLASFHPSCILLMMVEMLTTRRIVLAGLGLFLLFTLLFTRSFSSDSLPSTWIRPGPSSDPTIPRKIWQTWKVPVQKLDDELRRFSSSWIEKNSDYRHELLTTDSALAYVEENFSYRQDVVRAYAGIEEGVLRADFLRYLVLFADGGVYTDIDTHCTRPIEDWISSEGQKTASLVVGIEYDAQGGEIRGDFNLPVRLCQWTFMAKPGNGALKHVIDRVAVELSTMEKTGRTSSSLTTREVLDVTGPAIFTRAIVEYLSGRLRRGLEYSEMSNLTEPKLIADVLFLPVSAFASGQDHSGSKPWDNDEQLMSHHWRGTWHKEDG